jgi:delta24(24(1))-sterol reductase
VETPGRARRPRKSIVLDESKDGTDTSDGSLESVKVKSVAPNPKGNYKANGSATHNGHANGSVRSSEKKTYRIDDSGHFEFGGSLGVSAMMIFFPL